MIANRVRGLNLMHWFVQSAAVIALLWLWVFMFDRFRFMHERGFEPRQYLIYSVVLAGSCLLNLMRSQTLQEDLLPLKLAANHHKSIRQWVIILGNLLFFLVAAKDTGISRLFLFSFAPTLYVVLMLCNALLPKWLAVWLFADRHQTRTLLLGSSANAIKLKPWLERKALYGVLPVGFVTDEKYPDSRCDLPVLGKLDAVSRLLDEQDIKQVIMLDLPLSPQQVTSLSDLCDKKGARLFIVNDLEEKLDRSMNFYQDDGFNFIGFRHEPLECPVGRAVKRALDLAISLPVVVFLLPLLSAFVWILQRQSPGPLFFRQPRTGKYNREFSIYKFRTMHVGDHDQGRQATVGDGRIFPAGRWLRKLSIDEIPQFINVLKGEMSVVGPRPHYVEHDALFGEIAHFYRVRSLIKPGITGLAQVSGLRGETKRDQQVVDRVHSDLHYLEHWSIVMDSVIIFKTAWQMLVPPKNAY